MSDFARNMLGEQRKRLVGSLMQYMEEYVYKFLPEDERVELRAKVLASAAAYHDVCLDILKATSPTDSVLNEEALALIRSIHSEITRAHDGR